MTFVIVEVHMVIFGLRKHKQETSSIPSMSIQIIPWDMGQRIMKIPLSVEFPIFFSRPYTNNAFTTSISFIGPQMKGKVGRLSS